MERVIGLAPRFFCLCLHTILIAKYGAIGLTNTNYTEMTDEARMLKSRALTEFDCNIKA